MIKTKLLGFFVAIVSFAAPLLAADNPDPSHIHIDCSGKKIKLRPNGFDNLTPSQDTVNLQWIFNNYPQADIDLAKGTFHISELIEAVNYQGTIEGKGQNKTFIVGRGPEVAGEYVFPELNTDQQTRFYPAGAPWLFWFHPEDGDPNDWQTNNVDLKLKDFTIRLDGLGPVTYLFQQPLQAVWGLIAVTGHQAVLTTATGNISHVKVKAEEVTFLAQEVSYELFSQNRSNPNVAIGLLVYGGEEWAAGIQLNNLDEIDHGPINAQISIEECVFKNFLNYGFGSEGLFTDNTGTAYTFPTNPPFKKSSVTVEDCLFDNVGGGGGIIGGEGYCFFALGSSDTSFSYKENKLSNIPAIGIAFLNNIAENMPKKTSKFNIKDNTFHHSATGTANSSIFLLDLGFLSGEYYALKIKDNNFKSESGYDQPFVNIMMGERAQIIHNKFKGSAQAAISIGNTPSPFPPFNPLPATECFAKDNHFKHISSSVANIILGPASYTNTVEVKSITDVQDSGAGNTVIIE